MRVSSQNARSSAKCVFRRKMHVSVQNACFVEKCTYHCKNARFVEKTWDARCYANTRWLDDWWLSANCLLRWKMQVSLQIACFVDELKNACFVEKCTFHCKMPNVSRNNNAYFMKKCMLRWKMPNISKNHPNVFRWEMHVSLHNACLGEVHDVYQR